jgi:signal transduction histidine kinase/CheY-like chemotaxis protein
MKTATAQTTATATISFAGQAALLDMSYARLRVGIMITPIISIGLTWFYFLQETSEVLIYWTIFYLLAALSMPWLYKRHYLTDQAVLSDASMIIRWKPRLYALALCHGLMLTLPAAATAGSASFEFAVLLVLAYSTSVTLNASYQAPLLGVFQRFFIGCWGVVTLSTYWLFPEHALMMLLFVVFYGLTIYRHALKAHDFFVRQILLEEQAADSAAKFRAAKDEAEQALESKNLFLSTASHDLRQPVFAIGMLTEAIASQNDDAKITHLLGSLRSSVQSLNLMFNSLLDLSRIEAGHAPAHQISINLGKLVHEVAALFKNKARSAGLELRVRLPKKPMAITVDPELLRQALVNLTHNALRYTQSGGVLIGVRQHGRQWQIEVWDTGIGVADTEYEKIYSPYYRAEHAWRADATGHGLGLHVVARCAKLMGAQYGLTSRLGQGSRFWLRLEQSDPAAVLAIATNDAAKTASYQPLGGRCLVIEDDPQVVDAWAALLSAWEIDTRFATNSHEAFAAIASGFEPGVIFCDQRLRSGESGFDILRDLLNALPNANGAMVSGEYASPELAQAEEEGYMVIRKPLNIEQLYTVLSRWITK